MQGPFSTPGALAAALLHADITPERIQKLLRHAQKGTRAEFMETVQAIPDPATRAQVIQAAVGQRFRG